MLDHHPNIKNPGEFYFLFEKLSDDGIFPEINSNKKKWVLMII